MVQNTLEGNGIDSSHPFYESCTGRLYSLCKSFLKVRHTDGKEPSYTPIYPLLHMWTVIRLQLSVNNRIVTCQKSHASQLLEKLLWFWLYDTTSNSALSEDWNGGGGCFS